MQLFTATGDVVHCLAPLVFAAEHDEARIQSWADLNPALINDGQPMMSLGREISTQHHHAIDNLFIDGNGVLVVAEMKRGKSPRDLIGQVIDYAAYVTRLGWEDVDRFCRKRQSADLSTAFQKTFGHPLTRSAKPGYRLEIVAEQFDPKAIDAAAYLISTGVPLTLVEFNYFKVGDQPVLWVKTVLGEIPKQGNAAKQGTIEPDELVDNGYAAWLMTTVGNKLPEIGAAQGWPLRHRVNQQSVPFNSAEWPLSFGDCQFRVDVYKRGVVSLRFGFRQAQAPGLKELLEAKEPEWHSGFPAKIERPAYPTPVVTLTLDRDRPEMGNPARLAELLDAVARMTATMRPLIDGYFASRPESPTT
jgi:hypothetical protein